MHGFDITIQLATIRQDELRADARPRVRATRCDGGRRFGRPVRTEGAR